jgi:hypothetical protein
MWPGACAPSITVRIPASRALRHSSATGSVSAVVEVWWLRKRTSVLGPTADQTVSTISSWLETGSGIGVRTYRAPSSAQTCSQARSRAPYSRSVDRTSSPAFRLNARAAMLTPAVALGTKRGRRGPLRHRRRGRRAPPRAARRAFAPGRAPAGARARAATPGSARRRHADTRRTSRDSGR